MEEKLLNYGVLGVVVIGLAWYILYLHKQHNKLQEDWKDIAKEGHKVQVDNTSVLTALKTLLETTREKTH